MRFVPVREPEIQDAYQEHRAEPVVQVVPAKLPVVGVRAVIDASLEERRLKLRLKLDDEAPAILTLADEVAISPLAADEVRRLLPVEIFRDFLHRVFLGEKEVESLAEEFAVAPVDEDRLEARVRPEVDIALRLRFCPAFSEKVPPVLYDSDTNPPRGCLHFRKVSSGIRSGFCRSAF